jgi:hypothetical protein
MDAAWLVRLRWRRRGAWLWPAFVGMTIVDGVVGHVLPPAGETQSVPAAALLGLVLNLLAVLLLSRPLGTALRRLRPDLPVMVARDYAGTGAVLCVGIALLAAGVAHRPFVLARQRTMQDAIARAQAWIGFRAPDEFRRNLRLANTVAVQAGSIYRTCVPSDDRKRTYCVVVKSRLPFASSVSFGGYEPNSLFAAGTG